jgi:hypothetical protein
MKAIVRVLDVSIRGTLLEDEYTRRIIKKFFRE